MFVTILEYLIGVTIGIDVETELGSLYGYFGGSIDGKLDELLLVNLLLYTNGKVIGSVESSN